MIFAELTHFDDTWLVLLHDLTLSLNATIYQFFSLVYSHSTPKATPMQMQNIRFPAFSDKVVVFPYKDKARVVLRAALQRE